MVKLLGDKDRIEDFDGPIAIEVRGGFAEAVGDLHQIQDVDSAIAVDIGEALGCEIDFAVKVGDQVSLGRSVVAPGRDGDSRLG